MQVSHLVCKLYELIMAGDIQEAQGLLSSPVSSLDKCVAEAGFESDLGGSSDGDEDEEDMEERPPPEPEQINITAEQQADCEYPLQHAPYVRLVIECAFFSQPPWMLCLLRVCSGRWMGGCRQNQQGPDKAGRGNGHVISGRGARSGTLLPTRGGEFI